MKHGDDRNDFVQEMKKITEGSDLSKEQILGIMKSKLGVMSQRKMEDMIREGYSTDEIIQHLMTHGKTQEQETSIFTRRMSILLEGPLRTLTDKEKVDKLKEITRSRNPEVSIEVGKQTRPFLGQKSMKQYIMLQSSKKDNFDFEI